MIHCLKIWPENFHEVLSGVRSFVIAQYDHVFEVGDLVCLQEFEPSTQDDTGRELQRRTFATLHSEAGTPIQTIQNMLGHKSASTTMLYLEAHREKAEEQQTKVAGLMGF